MSINKKGEIATIITLGSLIILGLASLVTTVVNKKPRSTQTKAAGCASVSGISYSPSPVKAGQVFTCSYNSSGSPYTMACGWSKNGGWPQGQKSGKCSGGRCSFEVQMEEQIDPNATYELVGFDFRTECGPDVSKGAQRITLNVEGAAAPQPTSPGCQGECCGKPNGYIAKQAVKMACDSGLGRYVIIDQVCENGKLVDKPSCATCRECKAGDQPIAPVPGADLAVNECTGGCGKKGEGVCAGLPECAPNVTPVIVRSCTDTSFSCPASSPNRCQKNGAIWCYGSGGGGGVPPPFIPPFSSPPSGATSTPSPPVKDEDCIYPNINVCVAECRPNSCSQCSNGKYKCKSYVPISTKTPSPVPSKTPPPAQPNISSELKFGPPPQSAQSTLSPEAPTTAPTPIDTLNTENIVNTKGRIVGRINFIYGEYERIVNQNKFYEFLKVTLVKENSGIFGLGKTSWSTKPDQAGNFSFDNIERFYGDRFSANPNTFSLYVNLSLPNGVSKEVFSKKNFQFAIDQVEISDINPPFNFSDYFSKVTLNFGYADNIQKPVVLTTFRPFFDEDGLLYKPKENYNLYSPKTIEITLFDNQNVIKSKTFIYYHGYFERKYLYGLDNSVSYEIMWGCRKDNKIIPVYSTDPNLVILLEGGKSYTITTNISCN